MRAIPQNLESRLIKPSAEWTMHESEDTRLITSVERILISGRLKQIREIKQQRRRRRRRRKRHFLKCCFKL